MANDSIILGVELLIVLVSPKFKQLDRLSFLGSMLELLDQLVHLNDKLVCETILGLSDES